MWFLLAFSLLSLLSAARFAMRPDAPRLRLTGTLGLATLFTTCTGVAAAFATVGHQAPEYLKRHPTETMTTVLLQGMAESLSPAILGFTVLTLVALLLALGAYRESLAT